MRNNFKVFTIGGIEINVNWSWLLALAIITWSVGDFFAGRHPSWGTTNAYILGAVAALLLFVTVLLHELSHSFTARARGLPVNSITLFIFGGVSNLTQEPQNPRTELLVAAAGPAMSLVLSGIFYALYALLNGAPSGLTAVLGYLASINLILAIFNLIPGFPLDGGRILRAILWWITGNVRRSTHIASNVGQGIGYLFILLGLLEAFAGGSYIGGLWLAFIGFFLQSSAQASYQQAVMDQVLRGVDVRRVMDPAPVPASPTTSLQALVFGHILSENQRAVPVNRPDGTLWGLVTISDVREVPQDRWPTTPVTEVMTRDTDLRTVGPDDALRQAMQILAENNFHQLPVVQGSRLVGMLDRGHVLQWLHLREQVAGPTLTPQPPPPRVGEGGSQAR